MKRQADNGTLETSEVLISRESIDRRLDELAAEIVAAYPGGELTVVGVMEGSLFFLADLVRRLPMKLRMATVRVRSYRGRSTRPGQVEITRELREDLAGHDVLVVDDILDTGATLGSIVEQILSRSAASCRTCVLLQKPPRPGRELRPDFAGFDIPDVFVVGYGLDYDGRMRNLPDIVRLREPPD
jgi:hypoxanthine phosphoribosyltransferase